jgi:hypothetical protein
LDLHIYIKNREKLLGSVQDFFEKKETSATFHFLSLSVSLLSFSGEKKGARKDEAEIHIQGEGCNLNFKK